MTLLHFPTQPHTADKRAAVEELARQLGGVVIWPAPVMSRLTKRQHEIYEFVLSLQRDLGGAVLTCVIAGHFVITEGTTRVHMQALRRAGLVYHPTDGKGKILRSSGWLARHDPQSELLSQAA